MSTIFSETIENTEDNERVTYFFDDEDEAYIEAGSDILNLIRDHWDLSDESTRDTAAAIQDDIRNQRYRSAITDYNNFEENRSECCSHYVNVRSETTRPNGTRHNFIDFSEYESEEDDDYGEEEEEEDDSPYLASSPGAVCRGPCKNPSPDAYADRRDGTFVCYQCKLFNGVFGKTS